MTYPHFKPRSPLPPLSPPPILLPHLRLFLFHHSATAAPPPPLLGYTSLLLPHIQKSIQDLSPPPCKRVYSLLLTFPLRLRLVFISPATISIVNLHWLPLADACLVSPYPSQRPWRLRDRPIICAAVGNWEWWAGGDPARRQLPPR